MGFGLGPLGDLFEIRHTAHQKAVAKPAHVQIRVKKQKLMQTGNIPSTHPRVISTPLTLFQPKIPLSALSDITLPISKFLGNAKLACQ